MIAFNTQQNILVTMMKADMMPLLHCGRNSVALVQIMARKTNFYDSITVSLAPYRILLTATRGSVRRWPLGLSEKFSFLQADLSRHSVELHYTSRLILTAELYGGTLLIYIACFSQEATERTKARFRAQENSTAD
jgi:hypothetical protein